MNLAIQLNDWWISQLAACAAMSSLLRKPAGASAAVAVARAKRDLKRKAIDGRNCAPLGELGDRDSENFRESGMKTLPIKTKNSKGRKHGIGILRYPGIVEDAKKLGTNRTHLWKCLVGMRTSHSLVRRYRELQAKKGGAK